jgi:hypothetical protein
VSRERERERERELWMPKWGMRMEEASMALKETPYAWGQNTGT